MYPKYGNDFSSITNRFPNNNDFEGYDYIDNNNKGKKSSSNQALLNKKGKHIVPKEITFQQNLKISRPMIVLVAIVLIILLIIFKMMDYY